METIKGYEGFYSADASGFVWSHRQNKRLKIFINNSGYECLVLNNGKNPRKFLVHRLIAQAFLPNPEDLATVNHINGKKRDNSVKNLEWCSYKENTRKGWETGLYKHKGSNHFAAKLDEDKVRDIRVLSKKDGFVTSNIAKTYGVSETTIRQVLSGRVWGHVK